MLKKIFALAGLLCVGVMTSCQSSAAANPSPSNTDSTVASASDLNLMQSSTPQPGDTIVTLHTSMGDITLRFFPEEAPMAYENFVTHARNGYYDGVIFHRVIENFMIQGGDPTGTGMGGESIWGHGFGPEFSQHLRHFRGAIAMAQSAMPNSIGSQFYIVHNPTIDPRTQAEFESLLELQNEIIGEDEDGNNIYLGDFFSEDKIAAYSRYGGTPHLDLAMQILGNPGGHTVFGQVISGMDVVDAIAATAVDSDTRPTTDVVIQSVTVSEF